MTPLDLEKIQSLCIFRLSAMGDVVMMVPTLRTLQQHFPKGKISWIVSRPMHALLDGMDNVELIVIDKPSSMRDYRELKRQLAGYHFDVLLAAQASFRVNRIYPLIKADVKIGFDKVRSRDGHRFFVDRQIPYQQNHLLESFLQFAMMLGAEPVIRWDLPIRQADREYAGELLGAGKWLAVNPMASKPDRNWPLDRYACLIDAAHSRFGVRVVLTGGPSTQEIEAAERITSACEVPVINLVGKTTLKQLAAVLQRVDVLVSPDTGPAHLACAMGTRVVALFADITPKLSAPYLSQDLVVDRYFEAMKEIRSRSPDQVKWNQRVHHPDAMKLITVDDVLAKLGLVLA